MSNPGSQDWQGLILTALEKCPFLTRSGGKKNRPLSGPSPVGKGLLKTLNVTGKSQPHMQKPRIVLFPQISPPCKAPQGWCWPVGGPGSWTPVMSRRPALASGRGNGAIPCIPASAGKRNQRGSSFPSASPSLTFASQPSPLLETPGEPSRKEPSSSLGNGSPGCAQGPCEWAAVLLQGPGAQPPAVIFNRVSREPGTPREPLPSPGCKSPLQASCSGERRGGQPASQTEPN